MSAATRKKLEAHVAALRACARCSRMQKPVVSGGAVVSKVLLIGQAPGVKEPVLGRPFAWTAGKTLFGWFHQHCGLDEAAFRASIYMAAVCRCFPGKESGGGDRVPDESEIKNCSSWLQAELAILQPALVIPVGKLAIRQFIEAERLSDVIGKSFVLEVNGHQFDLVPLPHPSGASPWHRIEPGRTFLRNAMKLIGKHPAFSKRV
jgi:uracil-DNA glycosylase